MNLYDNLQELCKRRGLTPSGLCVELGISKNIVSRLKNDPKAQLSYATAEKMAKLLGVTPEAILQGETKKDPTDMTDDEARDELTEMLTLLRDRSDLRMLLHSAKNLSPEDVKDFENLMTKIKGNK